MSKLWFKRKTYGWGWTPCSWEGWLSVIVLIGLIVLNFFRLDSVSHSGSDTLINFVPEAFALVAILILICYKKSETPRWQWGKRSGNK